MGDLAKALMSIQFSIFGIDIDLSELPKALQNILDFDTLLAMPVNPPGHGIATGGNGIEWLISTLSGAVSAIALQLLFVFFIIELIRLCMDPDRVNWQQITLKVAKFFIFAILVQNAPNMITAIFEIGDGIFQNIKGFLGLVSQSHAALGDLIAEEIDKQELFSILGFEFGPLIAFIVFLVFYAGMMGTYIQLIGRVFVRAFKILAMICFSPLPIALTAYGEGGATNRHFIMSCVATVIEGFVLMLFIMIYGVGVGTIVGEITTNDTNFTFIGYMLGLIIMNSMISIAVQEASHWIDRWVGA